MTGGLQCSYGQETGDGYV